MITRHVTRVLPAQPGVCGAWSDEYAQCFACRQLTAFAAVLPLALAVNPSPPQQFLYQYKSGGAVAGKAEEALLLLLEEMLPRHEPCLREAAGVTAFDSVTFVPGTRERPNQPLHELLLKSSLASRLEVMLTQAEARGGILVPRYGSVSGADSHPHRRHLHSRQQVARGRNQAEVGRRRRRRRRGARATLSA